MLTWAFWCNEESCRTRQGASFVYFGFHANSTVHLQWPRISVFRVFYGQILVWVNLCVYQKFRSCQDKSNNVWKHEEKYTVAPRVTQNMSENYCKNEFLAFFMVKFSSQQFSVISEVVELIMTHPLYIPEFMQILP